MEIYLVRHGESQSNYDNKHGYLYFCGQLDIPLTERGIKSARELSAYFKNKYIDTVYVSDLKRTRQTYDELFPYDLPTIYTKTLRERSLGVFEGKNKEEVCKDKGSKNISMILIINTLDIVFHKKHHKEKVIKMSMIEWLLSLKMSLINGKDV